MQLKVFRFGRLNDQQIKRLSEEYNQLDKDVEIVNVAPTADGENGALLFVFYKDKVKESKKSVIKE